jgi:metallo-beta-lactamase family protein
MKIKFLGAARTVTGSKHLIILNDGRHILLDCGLFQGKGDIAYPVNRDLGLDPEKITCVILSHAHIDHSGNLPTIVKKGFYGPIFCTNATKDLCSVMLADSAHIQESDTEYYNKRQLAKGLPTFEPLYTKDDVLPCTTLLKAIPYNTEITISENILLTFTDAGHILGSAVINLKIKEDGKWTSISFTGDIGRYNSQILKNPQIFPQADYIICESTYGDRLHEDNTLSKLHLLNIITKTCIEKKGKLIIPAFSLGRTQEIVYTMDQLVNEGKMPAIKVFVDSPLSVNITNITRNHADCYNDKMIEYMKHDNDPFGFKNLTFIHKVEDSRRLNTIEEPCIIISASGMIEAGRIKHHVRNSISDKKNTILLVGYCEPSTLGGRLAQGAKQVSIFKEKYTVRAEIKKLHSFSAHGDYKDIIRTLSCQNKEKIKTLIDCP